MKKRTLIILAVAAIIVVSVVCYFILRDPNSFEGFGGGSFGGSGAGGTW